MTLHRDSDLPHPGGAPPRMPAWPRVAYVYFAVSSVLNVSPVLLAFLSPLDLLQEGNRWSVLLLAPLAITTVAAPVAGLRWGGPIGRAILGGLVVGLFALAIFVMLFAMTVTGTPQD